MQRISYQIQAYIGRSVLLPTKEFGQIIYFVVCIHYFYIFKEYGNGIKKWQQSSNASCLGNI